MMNRRAVLLVGVACGSLAAAVPAMAQESGASSAGDIIVTARRVEERLQDVPISITVFSQEQLTKQNVAVATDLATYTPSLSVNQRYGPEKANFNIRGFNQDSATAPTVGVYFAEVVGVRAQGGTTSGNTVGAGAFTDLQNVQVLKGPQGTLFGRNTTGGAVLLTPTKPTNDLEGYVEGTYGNYDQMRLQAAFNLPVADTFKIRVAVDRNKRDGYMRNQSGLGPKDYNDVDYFYGRLSIVADLTPELENYTIFHYSDSGTRGYASKIIGCATPTSPEVPLATNPLLPNGDRNPAYSGTRHLQATSCTAQLGRTSARGDGFYDVETRNQNPFLDIVQWQVVNTTTWQASDTITIKNIMSYGEFRERANFDLGSSNFAVAGVDPSPFPGDPRTGFLLTRISPQLTTTGGAPGGIPLFAAAGTPYDRIVLDTASPSAYNSSESTFTEELQIQGHTEKLDFVIGGYLEFSRPIGFNQGRTAIFLDCSRPQNLECENPLFFGSISESSTQLDFDNHGVFGQATYRFTDQLSLTGGIRWTFDKIVGLTNSTRLSLDPAGRNPGNFIDPISGLRVSRACVDSFRHSEEVPGLDRSVCNTNLVNKSNEPTWLVNVDYKFTPDLMVYAKYARGYRQGGLNFTNPGLEDWFPEKLDSYELGLKASFRGAVSGNLNLAGFYNNLSNQQFFGGLIASPEAAASGVAGGNAVINAGKSRIYGVEAEGSVLFFESLRINAGYTYLNTKVKSVSPAATVGDGTPLGDRLIGTPFDEIHPNVQVGSAFVLTPKHKLIVSPSYTLPLDESIGEITIGGTWVHQSSYVNDGSVPKFVNGIPLGFTPSTNLINLNLDWNRVAGSPVDLALFATNVTKEKYNVANTGAWNSAGVAEIIPGQPRFYGVRVRFNFEP